MANNPTTVGMREDTIFEVLASVFLWSLLVTDLIGHVIAHIQKFLGAEKYQIINQ